MTTDALGGLPTFLDLLNVEPTPDQVVAALVDGPLTAFAARAGILSRFGGDTLDLLGSVGFRDGEIDGFEHMPVSADLPSSRAFREMTVIVGKGAIEEEFSDLRPQTERWSRMREQGSLGSVVALPTVCCGVAVGALGFTCGDERTWTTLELSLLDALSAAVGMWLTGTYGHVGDAFTVDGTPLTDRQRRILRLVAQGHTNASIANTLGYSVSTVKQDVHAAMRLVNANSRTEAAHRAAELGMLGGAP